MKVEGNKSSSTFHDKSGDAVLLATLNLWSNIQIIRTYILKHDIPNSVSLIIRHLDFETLYCCFGHAFDEVMYYVLYNVEDVKKIYFPTQKDICYCCTLGKIYQCSFPENSMYSSKPL